MSIYLKVYSLFFVCLFALELNACLLAGCAVGLDYHRADALFAKRYISKSALLNWSASQPASFAVQWEGFNDPLLSELVTAVLLPSG